MLFSEMRFKHMVQETEVMEEHTTPGVVRLADAVSQQLVLQAGLVTGYLLQTS